MKVASKFEIIVNRNIKIVILKCPYANWEDPRVRELFSDVVTLKIKGYQNKHFFGVMPIDGTDFVVEHILICENREGRLHPVLGAKSLPADICPIFHLDLTCKEFFRKAGNAIQHEAASAILRSIEGKERRLAYFSSWTIDPEIRKDKSYVQFLKELFVAAGVGMFREEKITDLFGIGLPKFRTDEYFYKWGFKRAVGPEGPTPDFLLNNFGGIDAVFMHLEKFSAHSIELFEKYQGYWNNRVTLGKSIRELREEGSILFPAHAA